MSDIIFNIGKPDFPFVTLEESFRINGDRLMERAMAYAADGKIEWSLSCERKARRNYSKWCCFGGIDRTSNQLWRSSVQ